MATSHLLRPQKRILRDCTHLIPPHATCSLVQSVHLTSASFCPISAVQPLYASVYVAASEGSTASLPADRIASLDLCLTGGAMDSRGRPKASLTLQRLTTGRECTRDPDWQLVRVTISATIPQTPAASPKPTNKDPLWDDRDDLSPEGRSAHAASGLEHGTDHVHHSISIAESESSPRAASCISDAYGVIDDDAQQEQLQQQQQQQQHRRSLCAQVSLHLYSALLFKQASYRCVHHFVPSRSTCIAESSGRW